jgi:hypothetical protein
MQAAFQRVSAIVVYARVDARKKRRQRVGMRRVQFGAVESGRTRARDRVAEFLDDTIDLPATAYRPSAANPTWPLSGNG